MSLWRGALCHFEGESASVTPSGATSATEVLKAQLIELGNGVPGALRRVAEIEYVTNWTDSDVKLTADSSANVTPPVIAATNSSGQYVSWPEVAWTDKASVLHVAQGIGTLKDELGTCLYSGTWRAGCRHGTGKAAVFQRPRADAPAEYVGDYDGDWVLGMRHGKGSYSEDGGAVYSGGWAWDRRHGTGVESLPGGAVYRGSWCKGKRHGCGSFTWPNGRTELREYEHGELVAARLTAATTHVSGHMSRTASGGAFAAVPATPARAPSSHSLSALVAASASAGGMPAAAAAVAVSGGGGGGSSGGLSALLTATTGGTGAAAAPAHDSFTDEGADTSFGDMPDHAAIGLQLHAGHGGLTTVTIPTAAAASLLPAVAAHAGVGTVTTAGVLPGVPGVTVPVSVKLNADVLRLLRHSSANDLPGGRETVVACTTRDTVEKCLTQMTEHNVLSMPIQDEASGKYVAIVHVLDIFAFMLDLVSKKKATFSPASGGLRETLAHQKRFALACITEVLDMASHLYPTTFKPLPAGCPLIYPAQVLAEGVHAVPIVDAAGRITRMVTQADIIRFVAAHLDEMGPLASLTISELGLAGYGASDLVIAHFDDKAFDVLTSMRSKRSAAAPVVDAYGAMVANLSLSDVKAIAKKANFSVLQLPLQQFFTAIDKGAEVSDLRVPRCCSCYTCTCLILTKCSLPTAAAFISPACRP